MKGMVDAWRAMTPRRAYGNSRNDCRGVRPPPLHDQLHVDISEAEAGLTRLRSAGCIRKLCRTYAISISPWLRTTVEMVIDTPDSLPLSADRAKLERVFANLLDNALRYTGPGPAGSVIGGRRQERYGSDRRGLRGWHRGGGTALYLRPVLQGRKEQIRHQAAVSASAWPRHSSSFTAAR